jgi:hypothetical protein
MQLTITEYSTALFSTWYFIEEWGHPFRRGRRSDLRPAAKLRAIGLGKI